jgi:magnesium transporter
MTDEPAETTTTEAEEPGYRIEELAPCHGEALTALEADKLNETSPVVLARLLDRREAEECRDLLRRLSGTHASAVLAEMEPEHASEVLGAMREQQAVALLESLDLDDAADVVDEFDEADRDRYLGQMDEAAAESVRTLIAFDPESAGGIMNPRVATIHAEQSVDEAIQRIRQLQDELEVIYYVYVVGEEDKLEGIISMRDLILARPKQRVAEIMHPEVRGQIAPTEDREDVAMRMAELNLQALPVVDDKGRLLGIVTHDDVLDVIQKEATEDLQVLVGAGADEGAFDSVWYSVRYRGPWLFFNLLTAIAASFIVYLFEAQIAQLTLLAVLMPVIASMGGNAGAQTLAVAIRSLAIGEINPHDGRRVILLECAKSALTGLIIGAAYGIGLWLWVGSWLVAVVALIAMVATMLMAGFSGALIPLFLKRVGLDPAQSSSIFLTTVTDIAGFGIILGLGSLTLL